MIKLKSRMSFLDSIGVVGSLSCAIHCLLFPVLPLMLPSFSVFSDTEWVHVFLVFSLAPLALLAFYIGVRRHGQIKPIVVGGLGVIFLLSAVGTEHFDLHKFEKPLTVVGSFLLVFAHALNSRFSNKIK